MNISQEVREKIQLLSPGERIKHYLKMLTEKKITQEVYADILETIKSVPYIPVVPQGSEVLSDSGEQRTGMDSATAHLHSESGGHEGGITDAVEQNTDSPSVECTSEVFISGLTNGTPITGHNKALEDKSQKQRLLTLLSDYNWHRTDEIDEVVYGSAGFKRSRISARVDDLRHDGYEITKAEHVEGSVYKYRMIEKGMTWISENFGSG
jgi:biotin operon repressor